jgi:phospholipase/lecithinase/hemolysin
MPSVRRPAARAALLLLAGLAACGDDAPSTPATTPALFSTVYVFGASLDDTGNLCNVAPTSCPPPPYATARASNDSLWIELVAARLGARVTPARGGGTNYAFGGARTGPIAGTTQGVPNMRQQVELMVQNAPTAGRDRALFVVNGATVGNDITDALTQALTNPPVAPAIVTASVANMVAMVQALHAAGARHVLLVNSTDIGRTPLVRAQGQLAILAATQLSTQFNAGLAAQLPTLRALAGLSVYVLDLGALTAEVFANPSGFGFTNVTQPCVVLQPPSVCSTPGSFFFWDGFHPTVATGRLVAQRALAALPAR